MPYVDSADFGLAYPYGRPHIALLPEIQSEKC